MPPLFASAGLVPVGLTPILAMSLVLGVLAVRGRRPGLAAWCFAVTLWAASLLLSAMPATRSLGERTLMVGFLIPAAFHHSVVEDRRWSRASVPWAYVAAGAMILAGALPHGLFLRAGGTEPGPWFLLMFGLAAVGSLAPIVELLHALRTAEPGARERLRYLLAAGFLCNFGGGLNVLTTMADRPHPAGLYLVLGSLALVAWVVQAADLPEFGRFVEASLRYSVAAALLTTLYLSGVMLVLGTSPVSAGFLLFLLVLVGQPLLFRARGRLAAALLPGKGELGGITVALARSEARAEHAGRLAEIGTLAAAVAHEVRNPLGVIAACATVLERQGASAETVGELRAQVERAARFADELLEYGRPEPVSLRELDLVAAARIATEERRRGLGGASFPDVEVRGGAPPIRGDFAQIVRLLGILVENAALAGAGRVELSVAPAAGGLRVCVDDDGPGVPAELSARIFEPFVTGRSRAARPGTGLGLAIAQGIVARHHGTLGHDRSSLGGARFSLWLPSEPPLPSGP